MYNMAFTRQIYGTCATKKHLEESTGILAYQMDLNKHYNNQPRRIDTGIVGGNDVSLYGGNLVDLDSDLRGLTRSNTHCPAGKYLPGTVVQGRDSVKCTGCGKNGLPCGDASCRKEKLHHLPSGKIVQHKPRPTNVGYSVNFPMCATLGNSPSPSLGGKSRPNPLSPVEWRGSEVLDGNFAPF